jgi:hypothetical protein
LRIGDVVGVGVGVCDGVCDGVGVPVIETEGVWEGVLVIEVDDVSEMEGVTEGEGVIEGVGVTEAVCDVDADGIGIIFGA